MFRVPMASTNVPALIGVFLLTLVALYGLGMLAVLGVVFLFLAQRALRFFEGLARREGRLTLRGQ